MRREPVRLTPAYSWECPVCGHAQFTHPVVDSTVHPPREVYCENCERKWDTNVPDYYGRPVL